MPAHTSAVASAAAPAEPLVVDYAAAGKLLGVCPRTIWTLVDRGELPCLEIGRRKLIAVEALHAFVRARSQVKSA